MGIFLIVVFFLAWTWAMTFLVCKKEAVTSEMIIKKILLGIKESQKQHKKYMAHRKKFERKWLKQHASWADTRQKKKAMEKAFLKEFPHYSFYIKLERLGIKCKI